MSKLLRDFSWLQSGFILKIKCKENNRFINNSSTVHKSNFCLFKTTDSTIATFSATCWQSEKNFTISFTNSLWLIFSYVFSKTVVQRQYLSRVKNVLQNTRTTSQYKHWIGEAWLKHFIMHKVPENIVYSSTTSYGGYICCFLAFLPTPLYLAS